MPVMWKALVLLFISAAHAVPQASQPAECGVPQFGNTKVTISNSAVEYAPQGNEVKAAAANKNSWQFELTDGHFLIHPSSDLTMSIQLSETGLQLSKTKPSETKQQFRVNCVRDCAPDGFFIGDGCNIIPLADEAKCLQVGDGPSAGSKGDSITAQTCTGVDAQRYNFVNNGPGENLPVLSPPTPPASEICGTPDYQNLKVTIANSAVRYTVSGSDVKAGRTAGSSPTQQWVFEKSNSFFLIHPASDLTKSIQTIDHGLQLVDSAQYEVKQQFRVTCKRECDSAPDGFFIGDGCTISAVADTTKCLQIGDGPSAGSDGDLITLQTCDGSDSQQYNFENMGPANTVPEACPTVSASSAISTGGNSLITGALADDDESSSWGKWGPLIVGLLSANLLATLVLAGAVIVNLMRRGKTAPTYVPVKTREEHAPFGLPPFKDEEDHRYSDPHA